MYIIYTFIQTYSKTYTHTRTKKTNAYSHSIFLHRIKASVRQRTRKLMLVLSCVDAVVAYYIYICILTHIQTYIHAHKNKMAHSHSILQHTKSQQKTRKVINKQKTISETHKQKQIQKTFNPDIFS